MSGQYKWIMRLSTTSPSGVERHWLLLEILYQNIQQKRYYLIRDILDLMHLLHRFFGVIDLRNHPINDERCYVVICQNNTYIFHSLDAEIRKTHLR